MCAIQSSSLCLPLVFLTVCFAADRLPNDTRQNIAQRRSSAHAPPEMECNIGRRATRVTLLKWPRWVDVAGHEREGMCAEWDDLEATGPPAKRWPLKNWPAGRYFLWAVSRDIAITERMTLGVQINDWIQWKRALYHRRHHHRHGHLSGGLNNKLLLGNIWTADQYDNPRNTAYMT